MFSFLRGIKNSLKIGFVDVRLVKTSEKLKTRTGKKFKYFY